jgi:predicted glycosyltransferase
MALAKSLLDKGHRILILTGSPIAGRFDFPKGIDFVRIPGMIKKSNEVYVPHSIAINPSLALAIRQNIILATAQTFRPDLFLVDKTPLGLKLEVTATLIWLRENSPKTQVVLGLRDIMDSPESTVQEWQEHKMYEVFEQLYSEIWVYGSQHIFDAVKEYEIPCHIAAKIHFTGYIPRHIPRLRNRQALRREFGLCPSDKLVLVTTGGGGDGYKVIDTYLSMLETQSGCDFKSMIVTGPMLCEKLYDQLASRARKLKIRIFKFHRKMEKIILAADCVISMGGYNTMCEIISAARPMLIIPRSIPREEQLMRARIFAARGLLEYIPWETVTVPEMRDKLGHMLQNGIRYEQKLSTFPMTAFGVINSRIGKIGMRSARPACHEHEALWMPDYYGHVLSQ